MPADGYVGALDIGTSSVRALLFDADARLVPGVEVHLPYAPRVALDGTYETDPEALFRMVTSAVDGLLHAAGPRRRSRLRAIGVSTFWHGLLAADAAGRALTPLYLWADTRAWRQAEELKDKLDATSAPAVSCIPATGRPSSPGCARNSPGSGAGGPACSASGTSSTSGSSAVP